MIEAEYDEGAVAVREEERPAVERVRSGPGFSDDLVYEPAGVLGSGGGAEPDPYGFPSVLKESFEAGHGFM